MNWDLSNNGSAGSANGVMTLNSVRHKKRGVNTSCMHTYALSEL